MNIASLGLSPVGNSTFYSQRMWRGSSLWYLYHLSMVLAFCEALLPVFQVPSMLIKASRNVREIGRNLSSCFRGRLTGHLQC